MNKVFTLLWLTVGALLVGTTADAASNKPVFRKVSYSDYAIVSGASDNGQWAVLQGPTGEYRSNGRAKLVSTSSPGTPTYLCSENGACEASDVTDDGNIVVGSYNGKPAYWTRSTGEWTSLPIPDGYTSAEVNSVTPDGKYAVGTAHYGYYGEKGCYWTLEDGSLKELSNLPPSLNTDTEYSTFMQRFESVTADGRYISITNDYSWTWATASWIYDTQTQTYLRPGYSTNSDGTFTKLVDGLISVEGIVVSNNGKYAAATARMESGSYDEYVTTMTYNLETGEVKVFTDNSDVDLTPCFVDNDGNVIAASPSTNPVRDWSVHVGDFWYPFDQVISQVYGMNYTSVTSFDNTGTPTSLSDDGKVISAYIDPAGGGTYIVELPDNIVDVCKTIDLLGNYTATPEDGAQITAIKTVSLLFDRDIKVIGAANSAAIKDKDGNVLRNSVTGNGLAVSNTNKKMLNVNFRATTLTRGEDYTVEIPAGAICLAADESKTNSAITIHYTGRGQGSITPNTVYPANNSQIAKVDNQSNPIYLFYGHDVLATDTASAQLIRMADGEVISKLSVVTQDTAAALYPSATQYLYEGQDYKVVLKKGSLTDAAGYGSNDELTLYYSGTYIREITSNNDSVFFDDFSSMTNSLKTWMRYEGDHNTPVSAMTAMEFDTDNQPWNFSIRESNTSKDYCAGSHSMYTPAGKSDDWMVIPQIYVSDENYTLSFDAQSYKDNKKDSLKVIIWACNENFNEMTASTINRIKTEGNLVFKELLSPGLTEEDLDGDWTRYTVNMKAYRGKNVYIAFWNNNEDQSMVFVDNVLVKNNVKFTLALSNAESVVNQQSIDIKGRLTVKSKDDTYSTATFVLKDAQGNTVSTCTKSGLTLKEKSKVDFSFDQPLPLTVGEENSFSIDATLDGYTNTVNSTVKDLTFAPARRVILEEQTGTTCQYCPEGIIAIEHMKKQYGNLFLPLSLHTYTGDPYSSGQEGYATTIFGSTAAPIARIDRLSTIYYPMDQNVLTGELELSNGYNLWADVVADEFNTPTYLDVAVGDIVTDENNGVFSIPVSISPALNLKNQNVNVFVAVLEDSIVANQVNGIFSLTDAVLGDWGKGGKYGENQVTGVVHDDVVRAAFGSSYNGTSGFFPQSFTAGETYSATLQGMSIPDNVFDIKNCKVIVMLIDGNTDLVINANYRYFDADKQAAGIKGVTDASTIGGSNVVARYTIDGRKINAPEKGINILRMANGKTVKVIVK